MIETLLPLSELTLTLIVLLFITDTSQDTCKGEWIPFQDYCYYVQYSPGYRSFDAAKQWCEEEVANLTSIHSDDEQQFHAELIGKSMGVRR